MHTLISISAHIHMKHKKWYVTCVGAKDIYICIHVSHLASASRQSSKVHKHSHPFLLSLLQMLSKEFTDSLIKFMLSFFLYIFFFFASLEHFTNAKTEAVPNDFSPQVIFCWGECIYLIFIGTWNPSRYFLESEEIWDSFILYDSEESFSG